MNMALARLSGQKLSHVNVNPDTAATQLDFDLGATLSIRRMGIKSQGDIWSLYKPTGYVLSVRADGRYSDEPREAKRKEHKWKPISYMVEQK